MKPTGIAIVRPGHLIRFTDDDTIYIAKHRSVEDECETCALSDQSKKCLKICCYYNSVKFEEYVGE